MLIMIQIKRIVFSYFILLVVASNSWAQTSELSKFELGLNGGIMLSYRTYKITESSSTSSFAKENLDRTERTSLLPQGALLFSWNPSSRVRIGGGFSFIVRGYQTDWLPINPTIDPGQNSPESFRYLSRSKWIDIPLQGDVFLWKRPRKLNVFARAGLSYSLGLYAETIFESESQGNVKKSVSEDTSIKNSLFLFHTGVGMTYQLGEHFQAEFLFSYQRGINSYIKEGVGGSNLLKGYFISLGPQLGLSYKL